MSTIAAVNTALEALCILITLTIIGCLLSGEDRKVRLNRLFIGMLMVNLGVLTCDLITWLIRGPGTPLAGIVIRVANAGVYSLGYIIVAVYTDYLVSYIGQRTKISRNIVYVITGLCVIAVLLVLVSQANHMYYHFDEVNEYHRGEWYWLSQVWAIVIMGINALLVLIYRKSLSKREIFVLLSYEFLPVLAMVIQIFVYGLTLLYIGTTLSMFIIYVNIQVEQAKRLKQQEKALLESRVAIMLSQIQPHFLYNALTVIRQLCAEDPEQAQDAIVDFSQYLRMNLDSLSQKEPIPFDEELGHMETYLMLERRRYGDRLAVEYDLPTRDFQLPPLSIQPLVENAIRHGIAKRREGGTLCIRTGETEAAWQVRIEDDGVGYDTTTRPDDGRSHIGIDNVRERVGSMCGGTLEIRSVPGEGTMATLSIPKGGAR